MVRSGKNGGLHLKQIAYYKRTGEYHPTTLPSERSGIRRAAKKFEFKEKKLFYVGKDKKQSRLVIISEEEKSKVLRECHENNTGTHHGISRTLTLVESGYYWTSVTNDVKHWVYSCQHCQVAKNSAVLAQRYQPLPVEEPWAAVTADLMGPFPSSSRSHVYAVIVTDAFTKWVVALPLRDVAASEVSRAIISLFFLYGPPQRVVMDQGDEFINQVRETASQIELPARWPALRSPGLRPFRGLCAVWPPLEAGFYTEQPPLLLKPQGRTHFLLQMRKRSQGGCALSHRAVHTGFLHSADTSLTSS
uniref:Gypsy retrotransposon integrase-like protein 1 n=1 Tax=Monodelphis domestica TaxID=13616 RepID=A0A5F8GG57_MONDO